MDQLTAARVRLVQMYQAHPQSFPDGIEWKNGDHWYTANKAYWDALATANTAPAVSTGPANKPVAVSNDAKPKVSRLEYMRELMRKKRAAAKAR